MSKLSSTMAKGEPVNQRFASVDNRRVAPRFFSGIRHFMRSSPIGAVAVVVWILIIVMAVFAPQIAPHDPLEPTYSEEGPSAAHWLGTDRLGRDVLSRIIFGARITLIVAFTAVLLGDTIGFLWGVASGYLGNNFDLISQRLVDILMSFPGLILALLLLVVLGAGINTVIIAIAVTRIPATTRITRSVVLTIKETAYIEAARSIGVPTWAIMWRHVAPQCLAPILVVATLHLGAAIFAESALSFLGMGVPPPAPSWGNMLGGVLAASFRPPWWLVVFPGVAITLAILSANLIGDALRDFLDPKLRQRID